MAALLFTFPLVFALHEAEEVIGLRYFRPGTRDRLARRMKKLGSGDRAVDAVLDASPRHMLVAVRTVGTGVVAATALAAGPRRDLRPWQSALMVFSAHAATHAMQPVLLRGYTPGSITATLLIPLYFRSARRRLAPLGAWDARTKRRSLAVGIPAAGVLLAVGHGLGTVSRIETTSHHPR